MSQSRQLAAIMPVRRSFNSFLISAIEDEGGFTDLVGYTSLMGYDEAKAFELLNKNRAPETPYLIPQISLLYPQTSPP